MILLNKITLCADDFGLNPAVNRGILNLVEQGRLNAVSCLTNFKHLTPCLGRHRPDLKIGLHLNLTQGKPLTKATSVFMPLKKLIIKSHANKLDTNLVFLEFLAQLETFKTTMGFLPHFIDGHQHIHILPSIREAVLKLYKQHLSQTTAFIRAINPPTSPFSLKPRILNLLGAKTLTRLLQHHNIPHNSVFSGLYHFNVQTKEQYATLFKHFLSHMKPNGLIMCHPGVIDPNNTDDSIHFARLIEYQFFSSDLFLENYANHSI